MNEILLGSHVGMSGKDMFLGSVREAISYGANTFMLYTGAPQNTKRKDISELNIEKGRALMKEHGITRFVVHAPYIINLANTVKPEIFSLATEFLAKEIERTEAMGAETLILHPGSHVGEGADIGIAKICEGLNEVLRADMKITVALETMAGKGSEVGRNFDELKAIYNGVKLNDKLRVCFDTCHTWDSGYDVANSFDDVVACFDKALGIDQIAAFHINDSKNEKGASKDRHANIGDGFIGTEALKRIVHDKRFINVPKILETPYIGDKAPYKEEIALLRG